jgi:hypothetical protein
MEQISNPMIMSMYVCIDDSSSANLITYIIERSDRIEQSNKNYEIIKLISVDPICKPSDIEDDSSEIELRMDFVMMPKATHDLIVQEVLSIGWVNSTFTINLSLGRLSENTVANYYYEYNPDTGVPPNCEIEFKDSLRRLFEIIHGTEMARVISK